MHAAFLPAALVSALIAGALPEARLVTLENCGHFAYLECMGAARRALDDFFGPPR